MIVVMITNSESRGDDVCNGCVLLSFMIRRENAVGCVPWNAWRVQSVYKSLDRYHGR